MESLVCTRPGLLEYNTVNAPPMTPGSAILRIKRVGICGTDLHAYEGTQPYFSYPRILGHELAADLVESETLDGFVPGDRLTIIPYYHCGHCIACRSGRTNCCVSMQVCGVHIDGGMVDYLSVPASALVQSQGLTYDELALVEPLSIGLHAVRRANIHEGENVLVTGAGPIGLAVMEFARLAGARLIVLDMNPSRLQFCKTHLDVEWTLHAAQADVKEQLEEITGGDMPTKIFDATGNLKAINQAFEYMAHGATYILVGLQKEMIQISHPEFHKRESTLMSSRNATRQDFESVIDHLHNGRIKPLKMITHRALFSATKDSFEGWMDQENGVIKAMVEWSE